MIREKHIPAAMVEYDQWIAWESIKVSDSEKRTKRPRAPWTVQHTGNVDPLNAWNWTDLATAIEWAEKVPQWGLGFVFTPDDGLTGIDLDGCRDPETGEVEPWAEEIVERLDSYTEVSPSGTGLHVIVYATLDGSLKNEEEGVELYDRERFFTVTGSAIRSQEVVERQQVVDELMDEYMKEAPDAEVPAGDFEGQTNSPLYDISVSDLYPDTPRETNVPHPIHGSTTGGNFRIHGHGQTATCWRGEHRFGHTEGCGLAAFHLIAMRVTDEDNCAEIRERWPQDDELVYRTWVYAVEELGVSPKPEPYRVLTHLYREGHDASLEDLDTGGGYWAEKMMLRLELARRHEWYEAPEEVSELAGEAPTD